jgi:methyltransferase (TIGR00027 family)
VCETLLIPLAARVVETGRPHPAFRDPTGVEIARHLAVDVPRISRDRWNMAGIQSRTVILDRTVAEFLARTPRALVVNLGAGLCTRYWRMANAERLRWFDIDLPPVIELKQRVVRGLKLETQARGRQYVSFAADLRDSRWMDEIPRAADESALVIAEGLLMYLPEAAVRSLLISLADEFTRGEMLLESWSHFVRRVWGRLSPAIRRTGARLQWGLDDPRVITSWDPRLGVVDQWYPGEWEPGRWGLLRFASPLRRSLMRIVHLRFCASGRTDDSRPGDRVRRREAAAVA